MTVARSVADVLKDHVEFEIECIDRLYLNVYVPKLQFTAGVVQFLRGHRGARFASTALVEPMTRDLNRPGSDGGWVQATSRIGAAVVSR